MKFLLPNYSCFQNPWLGGYRPQIPVLSVLNWICWTPPPRTNFLCTPLLPTYLPTYLHTYIHKYIPTSIHTYLYYQIICCPWDTDGTYDFCEQVTGAAALFITTVDTATCPNKLTQIWLLYIRCDRRHMYYSVMHWDCMGINTVLLPVSSVNTRKHTSNFFCT